MTEKEKLIEKDDGIDIPTISIPSAAKITLYIKKGDELFSVKRIDFQEVPGRIKAFIELSTSTVSIKEILSQKVLAEKGEIN